MKVRGLGPVLPDPRIHMYINAVVPATFQVTGTTSR